MLSICVYKKDGTRKLIKYVEQITNLNDNVVIDIDIGYGDTLTEIFDKNNVANITAKVMKGET